MRPTRPTSKDQGIVDIATQLKSVHSPMEQQARQQHSHIGYTVLYGGLQLRRIVHP